MTSRQKILVKHPRALPKFIGRLDVGRVPDFMPPDDDFARTGEPQPIEHRQRGHKAGRRREPSLDGRQAKSDRRANTAESAHEPQTNASIFHAKVNLLVSGGRSKGGLNRKPDRWDGFDHARSDQRPTNSKRLWRNGGTGSTRSRDIRSETFAAPSQNNQSTHACVVPSRQSRRN